MKLSTDARRFMRIPLIMIILGAVTAAGAWMWNIASCCEGGAHIGAGMLVLLGLAMLAGEAVWALLLVLGGLRREE
jgi:hypothetical protein